MADKHDEDENKTHFTRFIVMVIVTCIVFSLMVYFWRLFPFTEETTWRPWNVNLYQGKEDPKNFVQNGWTGMDPTVSKEELAKRVGCSAADLLAGFDRPECLMKTNLNAPNGETMWNSAGASLRQKNVGPFRVKSWGAIFANVGSNLATNAIRGV